MSVDVKGILISVLLFSVVVVGGSYVLSSFSGEDVQIPGYEAGEELSSKVNDYTIKLKEVSESPTGVFTGFLGVAGLIKVVLIDTPGYAVAVISDVAAHFGIPSTFTLFLMAIVTVVVVYEGILLLRGVK